MELNTSREECNNVDASFTEVDDSSKSESSSIIVGTSCSGVSVVSTVCAESRVTSITAKVKSNNFLIFMVFIYILSSVI